MLISLRLASLLEDTEKQISEQGPTGSRPLLELFSKWKWTSFARLSACFAPSHISLQLHALPPHSFLFSEGRRERRTHKLATSELFPQPSFFLFPLRKRFLTDNTLKPCLTSIFSLVTVICLHLSYSFSCSKDPPCFWPQGRSCSVSLLWGHRAQGHRENFECCSEASLGHSSSVSINFEHSLKTFQAGCGVM